MIISTPSRFLALIILTLLASCRSEQAMFQLTAPREQQTAFANKPEPLPAAEPSLSAVEKHSAKPLNVVVPRREARLPRTAKAKAAQFLKQRATVASRTMRPKLVNKPNTAARRGVREEGEGKPALLVLGIVLVVAGVVAGFLIGGGAGFFVGLPIGLLGYFFFMKGLLGPNAWLEVANELFQL
ncbi:hypothetical protein [Hymenobacter cavernae]|uniref:hypothetical protein n=1 Tax=Hymenobacter cavernae TaxID=2044852 RepID=UPI00166B32E2|nr:hypothetical protein [Hymenobacter cavernae]